MHQLMYGPQFQLSSRSQNFLKRNIESSRKMSRNRPPTQTHREEVAELVREHFRNTSGKMLKVFQRLENCNLPLPKREKRPKINKEKLLAWIEANSKPRKVLKSPRRTRKWKPLDQMRDIIDRLSKPRTIKRSPEVAAVKKRPPVTITDRILQLSAPKNPRKKWRPQRWRRRRRQQKQTKYFELSPRIAEISKPKMVPRSKYISRYPFRVSPFALKAVATARIIELAKPKNYIFNDYIDSDSDSDSDSESDYDSDDD
jgi:hypothetical protein